MAGNEKPVSDVWSIRDVNPSIRNRARESCRRSGKSLGLWISEAILAKEKMDSAASRELVPVAPETDGTPLVEIPSSRPTSPSLDQLTELLDKFGVENLTKSARLQISGFLAEQFKQARLPKS